METQNNSKENGPKKEAESNGGEDLTEGSEESGGDDGSLLSILQSFLSLSRVELYVIGLIFFCALVVRILYLYTIQDYVLFDYGIIDGAEYRDWGMFWVQEGLKWDFVPSHMPAYAFLNYVNLAIFGNTFWPIFILQTGLSMVGGLVVFYLARWLFNTSTGYLSLFFFLLHLDWILFESRPVPAVLTGVLLLFVLVLLILADRDEGPVYTFLTCASVLFLVGFLTRANVLIVLPLAGVYFLFRAGWSWKTRVKSVLVWSVPSVLGVWFIFVLNSGVLQEKYNEGGAVLQANSGMNFYIGNRPGAGGYPDLRVGYEYRNLKNLPLREKNIRHPGRENRFFYGKGLAFIRDHPGEWFQVMGKKLYYSITSYTIPVSEPLFELRQRSLIFQYNWLPFGVLFAFSLVGAVLVFLRKDSSILAVLFLAGFYLFLLTFSACTRYRLPVVPVVSVLGGGGLFYLARSIVQKKWISCAWAAPLVLVVSLVTMAPLLNVKDASRSFLSAYFEAGAYWERGERETALKVLQSARSKPEYRDEAQFLYRYARYIHLYYTEKKDDKPPKKDLPTRSMARMALKECVRQNEENKIEFAKPYDLLGEMQMRSGSFSNAKENFRKALRIEPTKKRWLNLGEALIQLRQFKQLEEAMQSALDAYPDCYLCHLYRVRAYGLRKKFKQAEELLSNIIRELKGKSDKKSLLARAYFYRGYINERTGNRPRARRYYNRAIQTGGPYAGRARERLKKIRKKPR